MSKLISIKIDVTKIDKARLFKGEKGTYLDADLWINDEPDQYGNDGSISMSQTKEEREAKIAKIYIGKGKKVYGWDGEASKPKAKPAAPRYAGRQQDDSGEDIPF
jgi:hypothetical protein